MVEKPVERRHLPEGDEYELVIHSRQKQTFAKKASKDTVSLLTVTFDGRLEVTDPDALRRTLTRGLGRAKAYGCGLMTLAPVG